MKVESLGNFPYDGRMRTRGEQFDMADDAVNQHIELKRVKVVGTTRSDSPVTNNRQLEGGVDKTTMTPQPARPVETKPVMPMGTEVGARDLVANQTAARRASGKGSTAPHTSTAAPAGPASTNPKAGGKNDDGSPSKQ